MAYHIENVRVDSKRVKLTKKGDGFIYNLSLVTQYRSGPSGLAHIFYLVYCLFIYIRLVISFVDGI